MSWYLQSAMFSLITGGGPSFEPEPSQVYTNMEVIYGLPKAERLQRLKPKRRLKTTGGNRRRESETGNATKSNNPKLLRRPASVPLGEGLSSRWHGVDSHAVHAYGSSTSPGRKERIPGQNINASMESDKSTLARQRPASTMHIRPGINHEITMIRPHTSGGLSTSPEPWTHARGLMSAHDSLTAQRAIQSDNQAPRVLTMGVGSPLAPLGPSTNQAKWFASAVSRKNLRALLVNIRACLDSVLTELKPHNRTLLASLFQLRASSSEEPPESPRLTGRIPKEILIGLLNGLQILEPVDQGFHDAEVRWSTGQQRADKERSQLAGSIATGSGSEEFTAPLTLSWVQSWLRKRRMQTYKPEWRVSGQSLDSLSWDDFKHLFRAIAKRLLGSPHEDDDDKNANLNARKKQSLSALGSSVPGASANAALLAGGGRADAPLRDGNGQAGGFDSTRSKPAQMLDQQMDEAAKEAMEEVEVLFRQFEPTGNYASCSLGALRSSLYMNGYPHGAVTSMIEAAAKAAAEEDSSELLGPQAGPRARSEALVRGSEQAAGRVAAGAFARILASFHANKRAETDNTHKFNNCVRLLVVRAGVVADLLPTLSKLQDSVFPRLLDAAIQLGGTVEVEHITLDDYTDWLEAPEAAAIFAKCTAPAMSLEDFQKHIAECKVQVGHVFCLFLCDATLGRKRLPRFVRRRDLRAALQQLRKPERRDSVPNHGLRQNTRGALMEDSRHSRLAQVLEACYSSASAASELESAGVDHSNLNDAEQGPRSPVDPGPASASSQWMCLTRDSEALREVHDGIRKLLKIEKETSDVVQALMPAWQPTTAFQVLSELVSTWTDNTFLAVRDARDERPKAPPASSELAELLEKLPRDHMTWYPVVPDDSSARKQSHAVDLADKVRLARIKLQGAMALGLRAKEWSMAEQRSTMEAITESRWLSHVQVDCYNHLSTPIFQSVIKDTTYNEQRGHERELLRVFESTAKATPKLPQHKSQKAATRAIARYVEHVLEDGTKHEEIELATLRQKTQGKTLEQHVLDSLHSYHEALRLGASEWSLLDDELQFPIFTEKAAAHQAMLDLPLLAKQKAASICGEKYVGMTFPERLVAVTTIIQMERLCGDEDGEREKEPTQFMRGQSTSVSNQEEPIMLNRQDPVLLVGERGSGRTTAIALALKQAECMGQLFTEKRQDTQSANDALGRGFDGRVDSTCVIRIVGATELSANGNDLLRSIIMQIREEYDPQNHLQMAVPATQEDLEKGLITAMGMATLHRPLVVCVDGIDRLKPRDPARKLLWVPKSLPFHCRLIVVATPDMAPSESLSMFRKENVVAFHPPPLVAVQSLAEDIVAAEGNGRGRTMTSEEARQLRSIFAITGSLSLLKLSSVQIMKQQPEARGGAIPFLCGDRGDRLHESGALDELAVACLSMLAIARGGLSSAHLEAAWTLFDRARMPLGSEASGLRSPVAEEAGIEALRKEMFDLSLRGVKLLTTSKLHGKCMVIVCDDPWITIAVRCSSFFLANHRELCDCLIRTACDTGTSTHIRVMPVYLQTAVLPALQIQAARFSKQLKEAGPYGVDVTLCCTKFLRLKIEAGLLEDLLVDMQECLTAASLGEFRMSALCESVVRRHRDILRDNKQLLLKPFHGLLLDQMKTRTGGRSRESKSPPDSQWSTELRCPEHWFFREVTNEHKSSVFCTASIPTPSAITSCTVGSGRASVIYAVGLEDGGVMVWDGVSGDRIGSWTAHGSRVAMCHMLQRGLGGEDDVAQAEHAGGGVGAATGSASTNASRGEAEQESVLSGSERGLDESCGWLLLTVGGEGEVRGWRLPGFEEVLRHKLDTSGGAVPSARASMLSGTLKTSPEEAARKDEALGKGEGPEETPGNGSWTCCDSRPMGPDGMVVCFGSTGGAVHAAAVVERNSRTEMVAMDTTKAHSQAVTGVAMSREWCILASCSRDSGVKIWEFNIAGKLVCLHETTVQPRSHLFWCRFQGRSLYCSGQGVVCEWKLSAVRASADPASVLSTVEMNHALQNQETLAARQGPGTGMSPTQRRRASEFASPSRRASVAGSNNPSPMSNVSSRRSSVAAAGHGLGDLESSRFLSMAEASSPTTDHRRFRQFESQAMASPMRRVSVSGPLDHAFLASARDGIVPSPSRKPVEWNTRSADFGGGMSARPQSSDPVRFRSSGLARDQEGALAEMVHASTKFNDRVAAQGLSIDPAAPEMAGMVSPRLGGRTESPERGIAADGDIRRVCSDQVKTTQLRHLESLSDLGRDLEPGRMREDMVPEASSRNLLPQKGEIEVENGHQLLLKNGQAMKIRHCGVLAAKGIFVACHGMQVVFWDAANQKKEVLRMRNKATGCATSLDGSIILVAFTDNRIRTWQPRADSFAAELNVAQFASTGGLQLSESLAARFNLDSLSPLASDSLQLEAGRGRPGRSSPLLPPPARGDAAGGRVSRSQSPPPRAGFQVGRLRNAVLAGFDTAQAVLASSPVSLPRPPPTLGGSSGSAGSQLATVANMMRAKANFKRAQQRRHTFDVENVGSAFRSYGREDMRIRAGSSGGDGEAAAGAGAGSEEEEEEEDREGAELLESHGLFRSADLHAGEVQNVSIAHDGALVISVANGAIRVWDTATGRMLQAIGRRVGYGDVRFAIFAPRLPPSHHMAAMDRELALVAWSYHQIVLLQVTEPDVVLM